MNEEIRKALNDIYNWYFDECQKIRERAISQGVWIEALDANKKLFVSLNNERDQKVNALLEKYKNNSPL